MRSARPAAMLLTLALPLLAASSHAQAAGMMKQGLWDMTVKSDAMKAMPKLSPEQIEMMRQRGISVPQMSDGGMVSKVCISKAMAERDSPPAMARGQSDCQPKNYQRSGGTYSMELVCDGPNMKGTGTVKGSFSGNEAFTSVYDFKGTMRGQPVNTHQETSGKFVSADCGSVKPIDEMMPKK